MTEPEEQHGAEQIHSRPSRSDLLRALDAEIDALQKARDADSFTTWALVAAMAGVLYLLADAWEAGTPNWRHVGLILLASVVAGEMFSRWLFLAPERTATASAHARTLPIGVIASPRWAAFIHEALVLTLLFLVWPSLPIFVAVLAAWVFGMNTLSALMKTVETKFMYWFRRYTWKLRIHDRLSFPEAEVFGIATLLAGTIRRIVEPLALVSVLVACVLVVPRPTPGSSLVELKFGALIFTSICLLNALLEAHPARAQLLPSLIDLRRAYLLNEVDFKDVGRAFGFLQYGVWSAPALILALRGIVEYAADLKRTIDDEPETVQQWRAAGADRNRTRLGQGVEQLMRWEAYVWTQLLIARSIHVAARPHLQLLLNDVEAATGGILETLGPPKGGHEKT